VAAFACVVLCATTSVVTATPSVAATVSNGKIAFAREPDDEGALFTVNPDGSGLVRVGTGENVRFSPDGTTLLFACPSAAGDHVAVCTVDPDGGDLTLVVPKMSGMANPPTDFYPTAWSPDSRLIVIDAGAGISSTSTGIYTMRPDGTHLNRVTSSPTEQIPWSFSPDGSHILFLDGADLFVVKTDGTGLMHVNPPTLALDCCLPPRAAWSPDGRRIVFAASSSGPGGGSETALYTVRSGGGGLHRLTPLGTHAGLPTWSPDGRWIAFEAASGYGWPEIALVHPDGSGQRFVTSPSDGLAIRPVWSPGGGRLLMTYGQFDAKHQAQLDIWTVNVDGTGLVRLTDTPAFDEAADWGISAPAG
jgi:Tol biopolymer transport system component